MTKTKQRDQHYYHVAQTIKANPELSLSEIQTKYGFTAWSIQRARTLYGVRRKRGMGSTAAKRKVSG